MCRKVKLQVQLLDLLLHSRILPAIVIVEELPLLRSNELKSLVDQPSALIIQDVGTNLPNMLWVAIAVKVVILHLEVLAKWDKYITSARKVLGCGDSGLVHCQSNGEIEGIKRGLVADDEVVLLVVESVEVDAVFWSSKKVDELAELGFPGNLIVGQGGCLVNELSMDLLHGTAQ